MPSLQRKIQVGYYAFAAAVATLALLAASDLTYLGRHMTPDLAASRLLDSVLEIRRYEKNWLLYGHEGGREGGGDGALADVHAFAQETRGLIAEARPGLAALGRAVELDRLKQELDGYLRSLREYQDGLAADRSESASQAVAVRQAGRRLAQGAEAIAQTQHARLEEAIGQSRIALLATGVLAVLLAALAARWLTRRTTRPLGLLVERLGAIAEGRYEQVAPVSADREILAVTQAVNRTLTELDSRHRCLVQSEKLASLGTLVSGVAHELNNPLSNVSSSCQILAEELRRARLEDDLAKGLGEWLDQIDSETERARVIVRTLLDFSREGEFRKQQVNLRTLAERTLRLLPRGAGEAAVQLEIPADLAVSADPQGIQQVLVNLIRNALDSDPARSETEDGGRPIRVRVWAQRRDAKGFRLPGRSVCGRSGTPQTATGRLVLIGVEDNGPGIPESVMPRVFDPFFTTKDVGRGSGLGLYVSQEIVHRHGGCIGVESGPDQGARFLVALPDE